MPELLINDILTAQEAAEVLKLPLKRIIVLARRGELPAKKLGKEWRFKASEIVKWFADWQPNTFDPNRKAGEILQAINGKTKNRI